MAKDGDFRGNSDNFYDSLKSEGVDIRGILRPLDSLGSRERAVFIEYHYWNTHMRIIAVSHKISLGRAYEILYKAERKIATSRAQKEEEGARFFS